MSLLDPDQRQPDIIGGGDLGGKARGLVFFDEMLEAEFDASRFAKLSVRVPRFAVVTTELFAAFVRENGLTGLATDDVPDSEIAEAFQRGELNGRSGRAVVLRP